MANELDAEAQRYRNAVSVLTSMRRAYLKKQITADEYMSLRRLAIAGYVREADKRIEETIKAKYVGTREVF